MIKLSDISTQYLLGLESRNKSHSICKRNYVLVKKNHLTDFQKLVDYIDLQQILLQIGENDLSFDDGLSKEIERVKQITNELNKRGVKPELYETHDAIMVGDRVLMLREADESVDPYHLLYGSPFEHYGEETFDKIGYYPRKGVFVTKNIALLKDLLSHCHLNGKNAYQAYLRDYNIEFHINGIQRALDLYEDQILRQIISSGEDINEIDLSKIFRLNQEEKRSLVSEQYSEIAEYLSEQESYVWGISPIIRHFGSADKTPEARLIYNSFRKNTPDARFNRELLTNTIADYITVEEAENGLLKEDKSKRKVIERFVTE